jgi:hypothetical protein
VLWRSGHGVAFLAIEVASEGRLWLGIVLAMLNVQRGGEKGDGIAHELAGSAAERAARFRRGRWRWSRGRLSALSSV